MHEHKFDPAHLEKLNDPARLEREPPELLWEAAATQTPQVIVDLGAGTGVYSFAFARRAPGARVWACDLSERMIAWLEEHIPADLAGAVRPLKVGESEIPLPDGCADLVFMANLHHELESPAATLAEAFRILKPGGRILIEDWRDEATPKGPPLDKRVSAAAIRSDLEEAGFTGIRDHRLLSWHHLFTADRS